MTWQASGSWNPLIQVKGCCNQEDVVAALNNALAGHDSAPEFNDLVIATHGRSIYVMDDMTPVQQLQTAIARGTYLFPVRVSYQYNQREDDEGTYTNYAAQNPPLKKEPAK